METNQTAATVLKAFLSSVDVENVQTSASFFAEQGAMELPYAGNLGLPDKFVGHEAISGVIGSIFSAAPDFRIKNIQIVMEQPDMALAEYESEALLNNGRAYKQLYLGYAVVKDGKIVKYREVMDAVRFVQAFFPNGLADIPVANN